MNIKEIHNEWLKSYKSSEWKGDTVSGDFASYLSEHYELVEKSNWSKWNEAHEEAFDKPLDSVQQEEGTKFVCPCKPGMMCACPQGQPKECSHEMEAYHQVVECHKCCSAWRVKGMADNDCQPPHPPVELPELPGSVNWQSFMDFSEAGKLIALTSIINKIIKYLKAKAQ